MFENVTVKKVTESDTHFYIYTLQSTGFALDKKYGVTPKTGDFIKLYCIKCTQIRGMDLNGINVFYKSDEELEQERQEWLANYEKEKQERFEQNKAQMDSDYESLPSNFKKRIDRFRAEDANFRVDSEAYEMFCCKEALKIAEACKTTTNVLLFKEMSYDQQKEMVPTLEDGHSGNTFYSACNLAYCHLASPDVI